MPSGNAAALAPVHLAELETERAAERIDGLDRFVAVEALVRHRGVPVGWVRIPVTNGTCSAADVASALARFTGETDTAVADATPNDAWPPVTVVVCTRDRPEELSRCLDSLEAMDHRPHEVLVVDNAPTTDTTRRLVERRGGVVRYAHEPAPGLDHARNRGIACATGEVLAFTDDDVLVDPRWSSVIAATFASDPSVVAVTGIVLPAELETDAQVLFERYRSFARGFRRKRARADGPGTVASRYGLTGDFGTGANMAFRRDLFERIGPFDPALDVGTPARGGGDLEMFFRVLKEGHVLVYEPRAMVRHRHRRTMAELRRQITDHGIGFSAYVVRSMKAYPDERVAFTRLAAWWYGKTMFRMLFPKTTPAGALRRLGVAELGGCVIGLSRYRGPRRTSVSPGVDGRQFDRAP